MRRRSASWVLLSLLLPLALAADPAHEDISPLGRTQEDALRASVGRVGAIRAPLLIRPALVGAGGSFDVELDLPGGAGNVTLWLQRDMTQCALQLTMTGAGRSKAWGDAPDLQVSHARAQVVAPCTPTLYDLHALYEHPGGTTEDRQVHAVRVLRADRLNALETGATLPRIVVIADLQIGDPRAIVQAAQEGDAARVVPVLDGTFGDLGTGANGRWKAVRQALAEAKALGPDYVLLAGDLGFGQLVPGSYAGEYEEVWRVLAEADVPLFAAPGNHDGYVSNGQDGYAYWHAYLGPLYTLAPTVPGTWLLVLNTYDWSEMDRLGASYAVSAWGGQVRDAQLAWAAGALAQLRTAQPSARILAVGHHSPAWRQDLFDPYAEGLPVAEQVERGAVTYATTDQGWVGENRLPLRTMLRAFGVEIAFAGHTHHDRVARDDGAGNIVGTTQTLDAAPYGSDPRLLRYRTPADAPIEGHSQEALAALMRNGSGPLYLDTTTSMGDTDEYWGYRWIEIAYDADGKLDLPKLGYAMTQAELDALAAHPERYNVTHAALGLFSKPLRLSASFPWTLQ